MAEWIVVLGRAGARVFKRASPVKPLVLVKSIDNELGRIRNREMQNDRPGKDQFRAKGATVIHAMSGEKDPHEDATIQFVREISKYLESENSKGSFGKLVVVAGPHVMGLLKKQLSKEVEKTVTEWVRKNLSKQSESEIQAYFESQSAAEGRRTSSKEPEDVDVDADFPIQISFRNVDPSEAVKTAIYEKIERLKKFQTRIVGCEVIVSSPHKHSHKSEIFHVEVRLSISGRDIFINREAEKDDAHRDVYIAIRDAFKALERKLEENLDRRKGIVKKHATRVTAQAKS